MARMTELDKIDARLTELGKMRERAHGQIATWDAETVRLNKRRAWLLDDPDLQPEDPPAVLPERTAEAGDTGLLPPLPDDAYPEGATDLDPFEYPGPEGVAVSAEPAAKPAKGR